MTESLCVAFLDNLFYTALMSHVITFFVFCFLFFGMAIGLVIAKKTLKKGCSIDPDSCICKKEGKDPGACSEE